MASFGFETTGEEVVKQFAHEVAGKTIVITGASDGGLGSQVAVELASATPATIVLLARSANKVKPVSDKIAKVNPRIEVIFVPVELDKAASVTAAAEQINSRVSKVDILINNAGIMAVEYSKNDQGIENHLATNHVGHFLLTKLLLSKILKAGPGAHIVNVSSDGYLISPVHFDDPNFSDGEIYDIWTGYGQSKTANILFSKGLASNFGSKGITATSCHPGVIMATSLGEHLDFEKVAPLIEPAARKNTGEGFVVGKPKTIEQGVSTIIRAAIDPDLENGAFLQDTQTLEVREYARNPENVQKLWELSEGWTGGKFTV